METNNVGVSIGGIVGGQNNAVYNFESGAKDELTSLLSEIQSAVNHIECSSKQKEDAQDCIDTIAQITTPNPPKKTIIKIAFDGLKKIAADGGFLMLVEKLTPIITAIIK